MDDTGNQRPDDAPEKGSVRNEEDTSAEKSKFFNQSRKDKIRVVLRQKPKVALGAPTQSPTKQLTASDGNHRLDSVVSSTFRIHSGVYE